MISIPVIAWALVALADRGVLVGGFALRLPPFIESLRPAARACECAASTFSAVLPPNAVVENVTSVPEGGTFGEGAANVASPTDPTGLPRLCAVVVNVTSSPSSSFRFGMLLPSGPQGWNGRFLAVGNGGFSGGIQWLQMAASGVHHGFATLSTDTGHNSTSTGLDWALNNTESRADWGWRAMHESVALGKRLTRAFYGGRAPRYSYYSGCSTGGRQGLREMQMSPESFDGVLVGAPAWWTSHINTYAARTGMYNLPVDGPNRVPVELFGAIAREVVGQCDGDDGVVDGVVSMPDECGFNLGAMRCGNPGVDESACLSDAQIQTVRNIYADWRREPASEASGDAATTYEGGPQPPVRAASAAAALGADDDLLHPGLNPGSEEGWNVLFNVTAEPSPFGTGYIRNFVLDDPDWDWRSFGDGSALVDRAEREDPGNATADSHDITPFRRRGGKLIIYHGTADGLVPMRGSHLYYDRTRRAMGRRDADGYRPGGGQDDQDDGLGDFFRYFLVPGMSHCVGTTVNASWAFGAAQQATVLGTDRYSVPGFEDERHDALLALVGWVEGGRPVDRIVATTWNDWKNASSGVKRQRPLCPFPKRAIWDRVGDVDQAGSWYCGY